MVFPWEPLCLGMTPARAGAWHLASRQVNMVRIIKSNDVYRKSLVHLTVFQWHNGAKVRSCQQKPYFEFWSFSSVMLIQYFLVMQGSRPQPHLPVSNHKRKQQTLQCTVLPGYFGYCVVFSHLILPTKCPSVSPSSGERRGRQSLLRWYSR